MCCPRCPLRFPFTTLLVIPRGIVSVSSDEIGHNMGADHDRNNRAFSATAYGHGLRYCADDADVR